MHQNKKKGKKVFEGGRGDLKKYFQKIPIHKPILGRKRNSRGRDLYSGEAKSRQNNPIRGQLQHQGRDNATDGVPGGGRIV